jgi:aminoglycoside 3-N-acetyltransferase I
MPYEVKKLSNNDLLFFKQVIGLFREVFETGETACAPDGHLIQLLQKPEFICFVILHEEKVIAGLTAYELQQYYSQSSEAYIYDLAVSGMHQRKGLGKLLIESLKQYCRQHQINLAFVEAHEEDMHAIEFYHATGGKPENVVHFNYIL